MRWRGWAVAVVLLGVVFRVALLDLRPMHTDEAVHAVKFGALLETGDYRYDRHEYHGPTLNYFTLLPAWVAGEETLAGLSEGTLRIVPALFGMGLILLILSLREAGPAAAVASFLAASSPVMTYYSRYYIQETLLVFFTLGLIVSAYRYLASGRTWWALAAGAFGGLMFATKETWVISIGAMAVASLATRLIRRGGGDVRLQGLKHQVGFKGVGIGVAAGAAVSILFFSSFFTHWEGVRDSVLAYQTYFGRAGEDARHGGPWYYFVRMLVWWHEVPGPVWTEAAIVVFGVVGMTGAFRGTAGDRRARSGAAAPAVVTAGTDASTPEKKVAAELTREFRIFLGIYTLLMLFIISALPYKTPWLVLGALMPLILMAGWGVADFLSWLPARLKIPGYVLVVILGSHLAWQSYLANFQYYDDPSNPLVYSHPTDDVRQIARIVDDAAQAGTEGFAVQVVVSGDEYWPLPWYLRRLPQVGWWGGVTSEFTPTPVILVSPDRERDLLERLYESPPPGERPLYVPLFDRPMFLRPGVEIRGYVTLDLSNRMQKVKG